MGVNRRTMGVNILCDDPVLGAHPHLFHPDCKKEIWKRELFTREDGGRVWGDASSLLINEAFL